MDWGTVRRLVHHEDLFVANARAEKSLRRRLEHDHALAPYFAERRVIDGEGGYPNREGHLYHDPLPAKRSGSPSRGQLSMVAWCADSRGSNVEQQDALAVERWRMGRRDVTVLLVADGVSASGRFAARASSTVARCFVERLRSAMGELTRRDHQAIEGAILAAVFHSNFAVLREVLFDLNEDGVFDDADRAALRRSFDVDLPTAPLTHADVEDMVGDLDAAIEGMRARGVSTLTTLAVAVAVDRHVYTYAAGDSVIGLFRPSKGYIHLTERDQLVVELFKRDDNLYQLHPDVYANVLSNAVGESVYPAGTLRRYPGLLQAGDVLLASTDGLGPRPLFGGLDRGRLEEVLGRSAVGDDLAAALVQAQLAGLSGDDYQDNVAVVAAAASERRSRHRSGG